MAQAQNPPYDTSATLRASHGFFSARGGVSSGLYQSLNGGPGSGDAAENVMANRALAAQALSGDSTPLVSLYQVHGPTVVEARADWGDERPKADGMVSRTPGLALAILTADCCPVLFEDPEAGVIGAAHAGWRGAVSGVTDATMAAMVDLGARPGRILAAIGPTIAQASYEVGEDMLAAAMKADPKTDGFFIPGKDDTHFHFDLPGYVEARVAAFGAESVDSLAIDTYSSADHFSYRRTTHRKEPDYGRQMSVIVL